MAANPSHVRNEMYTKRDSKKQRQTWQYLHEMLQFDNCVIAVNQENNDECLKFRMIPYCRPGEEDCMDGTIDYILPTGTSTQDDVNRRFGESEKAPTYEVVLTAKHGDEYDPRIGSGTFGVVYKAIMKGKKDEKEICVKQAKHYEGSDSYSTLHTERKVLEECRECAKIVQCFGLYHSGTHGFLLLEYFTGETLTKLFESAVEGSRPILRSEALSVMIQLLEALAFIHSKNIIHYDIKPDNILYSRYDSALKLIDFGLAVQMRAGEKKGQVQERGTYDYMAPEVMAGEHSGCKSDVFSSGATFYHMTTLTRPYDSQRNVKEAHHSDRRIRIMYEILINGTKSLQDHLLTYEDNNQDIREIVVKLLHKGYDDRADIEATLDHLNVLSYHTNSDLDFQNNIIGPNKHKSSYDEFCDRFDSMPALEELLSPSVHGQILPVQSTGQTLDAYTDYNSYSGGNMQSARDDNSSYSMENSSRDSEP